MFRHDAQRPRCAALYAQRSELKASVTNALLGSLFTRLDIK
jgi:hypothetical protein